MKKKLNSKFDYSKLRSRIIEKCGTIADFATKMGWSRVSASNKLNGLIPWSQEQILKACPILDIDIEDIYRYWFRIQKE